MPGSSTFDRPASTTRGTSPARTTSSSVRWPPDAEDLPDEPLVVMCGHGERAMGAASLLARAGHHNVTVLDGWAAGLGRQER